MKAVYAEHRKRSRGDFVMDLPEGALGPIEGQKARKDAAEAVRKMLDAAARSSRSCIPEAQIGIVSAYRPATQQFQIWQGRDPEGKDEGSGFPLLLPRGDPLRLVDAGDFSPARPGRWRSISAGTSPYPATATTRTGSPSTSASA